MWLHHVVIAASSLVEAQVAIVTDRPDFTESTSVVAKGWQIESGATWSKPRDGASLALPETLVRWSAGPALEARLELPDYTASKDAQAWGEVGLGLKGGLNAPRGLDGSAWIASIGMPTEGAAARPSLSARRLRDSRPRGGAWRPRSTASHPNHPQRPNPNLEPGRLRLGSGTRRCAAARSLGCPLPVGRMGRSAGCRR